MEQNFKQFLQELDSTPMTPGRVVRAFRKNFDLTLKDVEAITKIKETNLSALENGKMDMTSHYAEMLGAAYGVHPSILLYPSGWEKQDAELSSIKRKAQELLSKRAVG